MVRSIIFMLRRILLDGPEDDEPGLRRAEDSAQHAFP